ALPIRQSHACWIVPAGAPLSQPFALGRPQSCPAEEAKLRHELLVVPVHVAIDAYHSRSSAYRPFVGMPCFLAKTRSVCCARSDNEGRHGDGNGPGRGHDHSHRALVIDALTLIGGA